MCGVVDCIDLVVRGVGCLVWCVYVLLFGFVGAWGGGGCEINFVMDCLDDPI